MRYLLHSSITPDDLMNNSDATCKAVALPKSGETPLSRWMRD